MVILVLTEIEITLPDFIVMLPGEWQELCSDVLFGTFLFAQVCALCGAAGFAALTVL